MPCHVPESGMMSVDKPIMLRLLTPNATSNRTITFATDFQPAVFRTADAADFRTGDGTKPAKFRRTSVSAKHFFSSIWQKDLANVGNFINPRASAKPKQRFRTNASMYILLNQAFIETSKNEEMTKN